MQNVKPTNDRLRLSQLFLTSLAIAGAACAGTVKDPDAPDTAGGGLGGSGTVPGVTTPTTDPVIEPVIVVPGKPDDPQHAYAKQFSSVSSFAPALPPGVELQGFVDIDDDTTCTAGAAVSPATAAAKCSKEWNDLVVKSGSRGAVIKRAGKLEIVMLSDLEGVIGAIDSPVKAALRARLEDYSRPASCSHFTRAGLQCAAGGSETGIPVRATAEGFEVATYGERDVCGGSQYGSAVVLGVVSVDKAGELARVSNSFTEAIDLATVGTVQCRYPSRGRMFEGFVDLAAERNELEYLVRAQRQEAAAVIAFERLALELRAHGAPQELVDAATRSAEDERRHASAFRREAERLCKQLGLELQLPAPGEPGAFCVRSLEEILLENAVEGCANETYAAIVATHQAERAPTARMRRMLRAIALDEQAHAELAHRIHAWGVSRVSTERGALLEQALLQAQRAMHASPNLTPLGLAMGEPEARLALLAFDRVSAALQLAA